MEDRAAEAARDAACVQVLLLLLQALDGCGQPCSGALLVLLARVAASLLPLLAADG